MTDYNDYMGWVKPNPVEQVALLSSLPIPVLSDVYPPLKDSGRGKTMILSDFTKKLNGGKHVYQKQDIGDCFIADTMVLMSDGSQKPIQDIKTGEYVLSADNIPRKVLSTIKKDYTDKLYKIKASGIDKSLICTKDHKFLVSERRNGANSNDQYWVSADNLSTHQHKVLLPFGLDSSKDKFFGKYELNKAYNGYVRNIESISILENTCTTVYCIEVENDHSFIAEGYAVHNCVSFGAAHAVDHTYAFEIAVKKEFEEWITVTSTEDIYGGSRVQIGGGRLGSGDGSIGSWAAKYVSEYGTLLRMKYEKDDLSVYSGERARSWGMPGKGTPSYLLPIAKKNIIKTVTLVRNYEEARDAIMNGYAVTIASNIGFTSTRDKDGFLRRSGSWAHQMCLIGMDDSFNRPGCLCLNSWGPNWVSGPTRFDMPPGSFWIDADTVNAILAQGDSFAFSDRQGFPPKKLKLNWG